MWGLQINTPPSPDSPTQTCSHAAHSTLQPHGTRHNAQHKSRKRLQRKRRATPCPNKQRPRLRGRKWQAGARGALPNPPAPRLTYGVKHLLRNVPARDSVRPEHTTEKQSSSRSLTQTTTLSSRASYKRTQSANEGGASTAPRVTYPQPLPSRGGATAHRDGRSERLTWGRLMCGVPQASPLDRAQVGAPLALPAERRRGKVEAQVIRLRAEGRVEPRHLRYGAGWAG